ncbi:MAG: glycoside hydrolase family 25 [Bacteroidetes bacterium]|nr:glycoside hydrolase family 25 [Bacteroidota bacterium]
MIQGRRGIKKTITWIVFIILLSVFGLFLYKYGINYYKTFYACSGVKINAYKYPILGIDVSAHQKDIDWDKVYDANVKFAFIKATEGESFVDKKFKTNLDGARKNDIFVGAYHFFRFSKSGKIQAQNFIKTVPNEKLDFPPVLDVELYGNFLSSFNDEKVVSEIFIFLREIEKYFKVKPIIYTNSDTYKRYIKGNFDDYDIWMSKLCSEPTTKNWRFWQYSHDGTLTGISADVDLNTFNGGFEELDKYINSKKRINEDTYN